MKGIHIQDLLPIVLTRSIAISCLAIFDVYFESIQYWQSWQKRRLLHYSDRLSWFGVHRTKNKGQIIFDEIPVLQTTNKLRKCVWETDLTWHICCKQTSMQRWIENFADISIKCYKCFYGTIHISATRIYQTHSSCFTVWQILIHTQNHNVQ